MEEFIKTREEIEAMSNMDLYEAALVTLGLDTTDFSLGVFNTWRVQATMLTEELTYRLTRDNWLPQDITVLVNIVA
jgi:hypothetical protein